MKFLYMLFLFIIPYCMYAQYIPKRSVLYQTALEFSSHTSLNNTVMNTVGVETVHGILFEDGLFFIGIGAGIHSVKYLPYIYDIKGDLKENMFHLKQQATFSPSVSGSVFCRFNKLRKLRKKLIPFVGVKVMHLWGCDENAISLVLVTEPNALQIDIYQSYHTCMEYLIGTELMVKDFPTFYIGLGGVVLMGTRSFGSKVDWIEKQTDQILSGTYSIKEPIIVLLKFGIYLCKMKGK